MGLVEKLKKLDDLLGAMRSSVIAYSGGVDSSVLVHRAHEVMGRKAVAVTVDSPLGARRELKDAVALAKQMGWRHRVVRVDILKDRGMVANPVDRCYRCKKSILGQLKKIARRQRIRWILDGSNADDLKESRPGTRARIESGARAPLQEAGLTKKDVRRLARMWGLVVWDKPATACLATRIAHGETVSRRRLRRIEAAEEKVRKIFGIIGRVRVRDFGQAARIEVDRPCVKRLNSAKASRILAPLGYRRVTIEPSGYRSGRMGLIVRQGVQKLEAKRK